LRYLQFISLTVYVCLNGILTGGYVLQGYNTFLPSQYVELGEKNNLWQQRPLIPKSQTASASGYSLRSIRRWFCFWWEKQMEVIRPPTVWFRKNAIVPPISQKTKWIGTYHCYFILIIINLQNTAFLFLRCKIIKKEWEDKIFQLISYWESY